MRTRLYTALAIAVLLGASSAIISRPAYAGYAVQPADGSTTTTRNPTFLVYVDTGDTVPEVEVSTAPDHTDYGFSRGYVGSCFPTTPFGEPYKFTCQLPSYETPLAPGTYYWAYEYEANSCEVIYGFQECFLHSHFSGPFKFTVAQPVAPRGAGLVSPSDGAYVGTNPTLVAHAPAGANVEFYASDSSDRLNDGTPTSLTAFSCSGSAPSDGNYTCNPSTAYDLDTGSTYYWWAIFEVDGTRWIYGP